MKRKHSFLLLELLIALALFTLCVLPLAQLPFNTLAAEIKTYQRLQIQRLADLAFADVKARLYQNSISWDDLGRNTPILEGTETIKLQGIGARQIKRQCFLSISSKKKGESQEEHRVVKVKIHFSTPKSKFFLFKKTFRDELAFDYKVFVTQESNPTPENTMEPVSPILDPLTT